MPVPRVRTVPGRGLLAFGLAYLIGEPGVNAGIAYEDAHTQAHGMELVSRALQSTAGLATAVLVFGTAVGGIAALAFCFALGRIGAFGARATAALVAGGAFATVYLVPFLKYPANPPGANDPATIGKRTTLYFLMIALTVLLALAAVILGRRLAGSWGNWNATLAAVTAFVAVIAVAMVFPAGGQRDTQGLPGRRAVAVPSCLTGHPGPAVVQLRRVLRLPGRTRPGTRAPY